MLPSSKKTLRLYKKESIMHDYTKTTEKTRKEIWIEIYGTVPRVTIRV